MKKHRAPLRRSQPARDAEFIPEHGFIGTDLTVFVGVKGRAIGLFGRPKPRVETAQFIGAHGQDLTIFHPRRGRHTSATYAQALAIRRPKVSPLGGLLIALRWLFTIRPKLLTIERYIWAEVWNFFLVGALGFTIFMVSTTIFTYGEKIFSKNIPPFTTAKILLLTAPMFLILAVPVAVLFSTLMAMNRFNRDNEITAMITNGVSMYRIFMPFIGLAVFAGLLTWSISEYVTPENIKNQQETLKVFARAEVVSFIKPGIIIKAPHKKFFFIDSIDKQERIMNGVRVYDYLDNDGGQRHFPRVFMAKQAWMDDQNLVLADVTVFELDQYEGNSLVQAKMPKVKIDIGTELSGGEYWHDPSELPAATLRNRILQEGDALRNIIYREPKRIMRHNTDIVQYYMKFAVPIACLAFVLVAVPVSLRGPRDERNLGLILSFVLVMAYYIILFTCREVGSRGFPLPHDLVLHGHVWLKKGTNMLPGIVAASLPPLVFMVASGFLIAKSRR